MSTERITLSELPGALKRVARQLSDGGVRAMRRAARQSLGDVQTTISETEPHEPVDVGGYKAAWRVENEADGADLFNTAPYAPVIEWGARPFWPPEAPLIQWAERKLRSTAGASNPSRIRRFAFLVRRKIAAEGIEGREVMTRTRPAMARNVDQALRAMLKEQSRRGR